MEIKSYFNLMKDLPCRYNYARGAHSFCLTTYINTGFSNNFPVIYFGGESQDFDNLKIEKYDDGIDWRFFFKSKELHFIHGRDRLGGGSWPGIYQHFLFNPPKVRGAACESIEVLETALDVYDIEFKRVAEKIITSNFIVDFKDNTFIKTSDKTHGLYFQISKENRNTYENIYDGFI